MSEPELKKTILIGLGGAGKLILTHLKCFLLDTYNVVPPCIKLLALDTDNAQTTVRSSRSEQQISLNDSEFIHLEVGNTKDFIEHSAEVKKWFIKPLPVGAIVNGAGAIRENGRVALFYHINGLQQRFDTMYQELQDQNLKTRMESAKDAHANVNFRLSDKPAEIYICGSLAGGTGSGTFLDTGILLRDKFPNSLIHGFFLLDWVYRNKAFAHRVAGNAYAALVELDNAQSINYGQKGFVPYERNYAGKPITVTLPPFNLVHLVDGRNEVGENIGDVETLCETVANAIFLSIGAMGDPIASAVDNLLKHINTSPHKIWKGRFPRYSSFGVSSIYYPAPELHRIESLENALSLCAAAMSETEGAFTGRAVSEQDATHIDQDVAAFFGPDKLNLACIKYETENLACIDDMKEKACPFNETIGHRVDMSEIKEADFILTLVADGEKRKRYYDALLEQSFKESGEQYIAETALLLQKKISTIREDARFGSLYLKTWISAVDALLTAQQGTVTGMESKAANDMRDKKAAADSLLEKIKESKHTLFDRSRKRYAENWEKAYTDYLKASVEAYRLEKARLCFERLLKTQDASQPPAAVTAPEVSVALVAARTKLAGMLRTELENLKLLKSKSNQVLLGNGNIIVVPEGKDGLVLRDSRQIKYAKFKQDKNINKPEDYLAGGGSPATLANLFFDYCKSEFKDILTFGVIDAIETFGKERGGREQYMRDVFGDLFRLSSALWSYNKSQVDELQQQQYDKIINLGVYDKQEGITNYGQAVNEIKGKYKITKDHAFSTTHDPYRIWMLNFAAALPVYFLADLKEKKIRYEEEITPSYHIDSYLEMHAPDLFPDNELDNRALRVLGMAIVPGIDVIKDEKLAKGHKFILDADQIRQLNFGDPKVWFLFREMYDEAVEAYNQKSSENLLDIISGLLTAKASELPKDKLKSLVNTYIEKVNSKLEGRDFSRLISARLTYREILELKAFVDPKGYGMDMDRYLRGDKIA